MHLLFLPGVGYCASFRRGHADRLRAAGCAQRSLMRRTSSVQFARGAGLASRLVLLSTNGLPAASCCQSSAEPPAAGSVHTRAVLSRLAVNTRVPSGLNAAAVTTSPCTSGGRIGWPVSASQSCAVPSLLAVSTHAPSGLNAAILTPQSPSR